MKIIIMIAITLLPQSVTVSKPMYAVVLIHVVIHVV
jgi:hypothetical protein